MTIKTSHNTPKNTAELKQNVLDVRIITNEDIQQRNLPEDTTGVVIVNIEPDSPKFWDGNTAKRCLLELINY